LTKKDKPKKHIKYTTIQFYYGMISPALRFVSRQLSSNSTWLDSTRHARLDLLDWLDKVERVESSRVESSQVEFEPYRLETLLRTYVYYSFVA